MLKKQFFRAWLLMNICLGSHKYWMFSRRKVSKSTGVIHKSSFCLPTASLRSLYYSLVYLYLMYCLMVWGSIYHSYLKPVVTLQKRATRVISKVSYYSHTEHLFKDLRILSINMKLVNFSIFILRVFFRILFEKCLPWQTKYIHIKLETQTLFIPFHIEQMFENSRYAFKAPNFLILFLLIFVTQPVLDYFVKSLKDIFFLNIFPDNFFVGKLSLLFCFVYVFVFFFLLYNYNLVLRCVMEVQEILKYSWEIS